MRSKTVPIANVRLLMAAMDFLMQRSPGQPGIGLVWGAPGYGKTSATKWMANKVNALLLNAWPTWSPSSLLGKLMEEMGARPLPRIQAMIDFLVRELIIRPRPIVIDEADFIADKPILVDTLRTLHDVVDVPIIMVGMGDFRRRAAHRPQLQRRIVRDVEFKPATLQDARQLADELCEVTIQDDLVAALHARGGGSVGLFVNELANAEFFARKHRMTALDVPVYLEGSAKPVLAAVK